MVWRIIPIYQALRTHRGTNIAVADPDLEQGGGGGGRGEGGGGLDLLALPAIFSSVISSFFTQNKGGPGPPGPLP